MIERNVATTTHGRYLVRAAVGRAAGWLVGFHGYAEGAEAQLQRLDAIPGADRWHVIAIQGLHRFYQRRTNEVIASWMTRQNRELAIADNLAYVEAVLDAVSHEFPARGDGSDQPASDNRRSRPRLVFAGFSQGVAMAFRAACATRRPIDGVIAVGGDVPPEIDAGSLARVRTALIGRGVSDEWYTDDKFQNDAARIRQSGAAVRPVPFDGGHEWSGTVIEEAAAFLRTLADMG